MDWLLGKSTRNHGFYNDIFRAFLEIFPKTPMITTAACFAALMVFGIFPEIHNDWGIWDLKCSHEMAVRAVKSRRFVDTPVWFHDFLLKYMKSNFLAVRTKNTHEINICWLLNHNRISFFAAFWVVESPFFFWYWITKTRGLMWGAFLGAFTPHGPMNFSKTSLRYRWTGDW